LINLKLYYLENVNQEKIFQKEHMLWHLSIMKLSYLEWVKMPHVYHIWSHQVQSMIHLNMDKYQQLEKLILLLKD